jgi:integrase
VDLKKGLERLLAKDLENAQLIKKVLMKNKLEMAVETAMDLRPRTKELYLGCVKEYVAFAGSDPEGWTLGSVEDWFAHLMTNREGGALQPQTVRIYRKAIRYASRRYAKREKKENFADLVDRVKAEPVEREPVLEPKELKKLLNACLNGTNRGSRDYTLIAVAARTGLRRGGLFALSWEFVDFKKGTITTAQKGGGTITFEMDEETVTVLQNWKQISRPGKAGPVFVKVDEKDMPLSQRLTAWEIWNVFRTRSKQVLGRHVYPHLMRHSTVTWLRDAGVSSMDVRRLTGQTEATIENIYTHSRKQGAVGSSLGKLPVKIPGRKDEDDEEEEDGE